MQTSSVQAVRRVLRTAAGGGIPRDADSTLVAHMAELDRRVRRLNQSGGALAAVRLSSDLLTWRTALEATA
mgnify:CR=1 FL=1